ncbi:MAG TPA: FeoA family protein [Steroidobacteraceae bacterium]|nr:FeoA family protein [Steroidobacteraceae bacterium]
MSERATSLSLIDLPVGRPARVVGIETANREMDAAEQRRLAAIGFLPGEFVAVVAHSPLGRNPIAVSIGNNMFGLRRVEAECIRVSLEPA